MNKKKKIIYSAIALTTTPFLIDGDEASANSTITENDINLELTGDVNTTRAHEGRLHWNLNFRVLGNDVETEGLKLRYKYSETQVGDFTDNEDSTISVEFSALNGKNFIENGDYYEVSLNDVRSGYDVQLPITVKSAYSVKTDGNLLIEVVDNTGRVIKSVNKDYRFTTPEIDLPRVEYVKSSNGDINGKAVAGYHLEGSNDVVADSILTFQIITDEKLKNALNNNEISMEDISYNIDIIGESKENFSVQSSPLMSSTDKVYFYIKYKKPTISEGDLKIRVRYEWKQKFNRYIAENRYSEVITPYTFKEGTPTTGIINPRTYILPATDSDTIIISNSMYENSSHYLGGMSDGTLTPTKGLYTASLNYGDKRYFYNTYHLAHASAENSLISYSSLEFLIPKNSTTNEKITKLDSVDLFDYSYLNELPQGTAIYKVLESGEEVKLWDIVPKKYFYTEDDFIDVSDAISIKIKIPKPVYQNAIKNIKIKINWIDDKNINFNNKTEYLIPDLHKETASSIDTTPRINTYYAGIKIDDYPVRYTNRVGFIEP